MSLTREYMIAEIKKHKDKRGNPYTSIWTRDGAMLLEEAPKENVFCMYRRITGAKGVNKSITGAKAQKG